MIKLAIDVPGQFYTEAITKALLQTGNFSVGPLEDYATEGQFDEGIGSLLAANDGMPAMRNGPEIALLGVSVRQGYTLKERTGIIHTLRTRAPNCRIVLFLDELVSPEQTEGVKNLRQARLIDGFLYASGTMDYLVATLESV